MNTRIRIALAALLIAFAIAFSANQLGGFTGMSSDTAGTKPPRGVVLALVSIKPPADATPARRLVTNEKLEDTGCC
jgi:hypothetical protein